MDREGAPAPVATLWLERLSVVIRVLYLGEARQARGGSRGRTTLPRLLSRSQWPRSPSCIELRGVDDQRDLLRLVEDRSSCVGKEEAIQVAITPRGVSMRDERCVGRAVEVDVSLEATRQAGGGGARAP